MRIKRLICWLRGHLYILHHGHFDRHLGSYNKCDRCQHSYPVALIAITPTTASVGGIVRAGSGFQPTPPLHKAEPPTDPSSDPSPGIVPGDKSQI